MNLLLFGLGAPIKLNCKKTNGFATRFDEVLDLLECTIKERTQLLDVRDGLVFDLAQGFRSNSFDKITFTRKIDTKKHADMRVGLTERSRDWYSFPDLKEQILTVGRNVDGVWYDYPVSLDLIRYGLMVGLYGTGKLNARRIQPVFD